MTYAIYEGFFSDVEKKLNRIAKKCAKHGNDFIFEIKGEEIKSYENKETKLIEHFKFILVEVEGTAKIENWECVAVVENHDAGNIIRKINTEIDIPNRFKFTENICEHCNSKRQRKNLYVIHNVNTDEWKQVGGSCLKLYTNGLNMEYITAYMDGITTLEEANSVPASGGNVYYAVEEVLSYAVEVIDKVGYFNAQSQFATKYMVSPFLYNHLYKAIELVNKDLKANKFNVRLESEDFFKEETKSTVEAIIEYYKGIDDDTEFIHNIKVLLNEGYTTIKNIGFLCYLSVGYAKHIQKEIEKAERMKEKHEHFGEVGKRYKDMKIKLFRCTTAWETQWGITYIHQIVLEDGTVLTWKTSDAMCLEPKQEFDKITFTVKNHGEYKGQKQTEVARCKVSLKEVR